MSPNFCSVYVALSKQSFPKIHETVVTICFEDIFLIIQAPESVSLEFHEDVNAFNHRLNFIMHGDLYERKTLRHFN